MELIIGSVYEIDDTFGMVINDFEYAGLIVKNKPGSQPEHYFKRASKSSKTYDYCLASPFVREFKKEEITNIEIRFRASKYFNVLSDLSVKHEYNKV